jgi:excisionase family DNA binding protein
MSDEPELLTITEVADMWRVSKMTVYRLAHSGQLPIVRIGRSFRVRREHAQARLNDKPDTRPPS